MGCVYKCLLGCTGLLVLQGCTFLINSIAKQATDSHVHTFSVPVNRIGDFQACLNDKAGFCPHTVSLETFLGGRVENTINPVSIPNEPHFYTAEDVRTDNSFVREKTAVTANMAADVLSGSFHKKIISLFNVLNGSKGTSDVPLTRSDDGDRVKFVVSVQEIEDYQKQIEAVTLLGGWDALANVRETDPVRESRNQYYRTYFRAFFRDGKFIKAKISVSELKNRLIEKLSQTLPGLEQAEYERLVRELFPEYNFDSGTNEYFFGKIGDTGLVTRDGSSLAFPGVEISASLGSSEIDIPELDYLVIGTDLIRVLLEAEFDSFLRVPAVSNATGASKLIDAEYRLVNFGEADSSIYEVSTEEFGEIKRISTQAESVIGSGVGRIVRGASLFSLNNEALAKAIETAVGMAAKKATEKVVWCWYQCKLGEGQQDSFLALQGGHRVDVDIVIEGIEHKVTATASK